MRFKKPDTNGVAVPPENSVQPTVEGRCRAGVSTSGRRQAILAGTAGTHGEIRVGTRMVKKLERLEIVWAYRVQRFGELQLLFAKEGESKLLEFAPTC